MGMLYTKPKGMKYTDLCIFFDNNFWLEDEKYDEVKCYKYLYCIVYVVAVEKKLLKLYSDYDSFVLYATNRLFMTSLKKKRNNLPRIKNILDYTKSALYGLKILWAKEEYTQTLGSKINDKFDAEAMKNILRENISGQYNQKLKEAIIDSFSLIPDIIKEETKDLPYKNNKVTMRNIELSCILSLYKTFKLNEKQIKTLKSSDNINGSFFEANKEENLTLFRLDDSMRDIIQLICNKIRKNISNQILAQIHNNTLDTVTLDNILATAWEASGYKEKNEDSSEWED